MRLNLKKKLVHMQNMFQNEKLKKYIFNPIWWILLVIIGYAINETLDTLREKPDVTAVLEPLAKDEFGLNFPIKIINIGDKPLNELSSRIKNCYMDDYKQLQTIILMEKRASSSLRFSERQTMSTITKKLCLPEYNFSFNNCEVEFYILNSTTLYTPESNCSVYFCDFCAYSIKIKSKEMEKEKEISGWFIAPKEIKLRIIPKDNYPDIDINKLSKFSPVGFNLFSSFELCLYNETCPFYNTSNRIENKESALYSYLLQQLYPLNLTVTMPPNKKGYNYNNITFYITYTKEQEKEIFENAFNISLRGYNIRNVEVIRETS